MNEMIVTNNLSKAFDENIAVDRLSISIPKGEVFGLLGPNGAGKTTTLRMLTALISPTSGEASVAGFNVGVDDYDIRKNVGILDFEQHLINRPQDESKRGTEFVRDIGKKLRFHMINLLQLFCLNLF